MRCSFISSGQVVLRRTVLQDLGSICSFGPSWRTGVWSLQRKHRSLNSSKLARPQIVARHGRRGGQWRESRWSRRRERRVTASELVTAVEAYWTKATPSARLLTLASAFVAISLLTTSLNALFHISFILAFAVIPFLALPVFLTLFAGISLFSILAMATAGAGAVFIGTPFFMLTLAAKALLPGMVAVGIIGSLFSTVIRAGGNAFRRVSGRPHTAHPRNIPSTAAESVVSMEEEEDGMAQSVEKELADFDRLLRRRSVADSMRDSRPVTAWSVSDVIDELDSCGLSPYRQMFIEERVDGSTLLSLSDQDIRTEFSGMPLGDRRRLARLVTELRRRPRP